jgi:hypothetical protein
LVGKLHDSTGSYSTGFTILIFIALAGALAVAMLPRRGAYLPGSESPIGAPVTPKRA